MWGEAGVGGFGSGWVGRGVVRQAHQGRQVRFGGWLLLGPGRGRRDDDGDSSSRRGGGSSRVIGITGHGSIERCLS